MNDGSLCSVYPCFIRFDVGTANLCQILIIVEAAVYGIFVAEFFDRDACSVIAPEVIRIVTFVSWGRARADHEQAEKKK